MRSRVLIGAGLGLLLVPSGATAATVRVKNIEFRPGVTRIGAGQTVTWKFQDRSVSHNVTSRGERRFRSSRPGMRAGTRHSVKFGRSGTYRYVCTIHPNMRGRVVVR